MKSGRIPGAVLAAILAVEFSAYAQTAPDSALPPGDATRGKAVFEGKGNCLGCHRVQGVGSLFGPDLSTIGAPPAAGRGRGRGRGGDAGAAPPIPGALGGRGEGPPPQQFAQSLLDPNAVVAPQNRYVRLDMKDGRTVTGKLLSIDTFYIQIFDSTEKLANVAKDDIREMTMASPMPSYRDRLTTQELADVISYLASLRP